jgi:hypothetical protein
MLAASILLRLIVFANNWQFTKFENIYFLGNTLILMTGVFFGIKFFKQKQPVKTKFLEDIKAGMKVAGLYSLCLTFFAYCYYSFIDSTYFATKIQNQVNLAVEGGASGGDLVKMKETMAFVLSPYFQSTVTLILFVLLGAFYSSLITFFVRKARMES